MRTNLHIPASAAQTVAQRLLFLFQPLLAGEEVFAKQSHLTAVARPGSIAATYPGSNMRPAYSASVRGVSGLEHVHTLPAPLARAGAFPWCSEMLQCAPMSRLPLNTAALQLNQ